MSEEEKKAIEIVKNIKEKDLLDCWDQGEEEYKSIQILLNLIEKQNNELKSKDKQIDRYQNMLATNDMLHVMECENKDKIIEKMRLKIAKADNSDTYCIGKKKMCPHDNPTLNKCAECVKKYYEKRYEK